VLITGLIRKPGSYSLLNSKYSLYDLLNDAGGVLKDAALNGIKVKRINAAKAIIEEVANGKDSFGFAVKEQKGFLEFGVNIKALYKTQGKDFRYNVILKNGDEISVPKVDNTIEVIGEVGQPTVLTYEKNMRAKHAIERAGGLNDLAKKSAVFIIYQNGNVKSTKTFLIFNKSPKLEPGAKVIVPARIPNPNKTSLTELIGLTSTLATLTVLLRSL
jgi:protein involved in polysaccharide export with SLBB domain